MKEGYGSRIRWILFLCAGFSVFAMPAAYAYLDPGSGSFIAQIAVGSIVAVGLFFKTFWHRIRAVVARLTGRARGPEAATGADDD